MHQILFEHWSSWLSPGYCHSEFWNHLTFKGNSSQAEQLCFSVMFTVFLTVLNNVRNSLYCATEMALHLYATVPTGLIPEPHTLGKILWELYTKIQLVNQPFSSKSLQRFTVHSLLWNPVSKANNRTPGTRS